MGTVVRIRKGKPIQVDEQIIRWRKKRRRAAQLQKLRSEALTAVLSAFKGDQGEARQWLSEARIQPYNASPGNLIKRGKVKAVLRELKKLDVS